MLADDLKDPKTYPEKPSKIDMVETHISQVFIGDKYVYKIKKEVNFGFLNFSTLEKRKYYCEKEVELNRRFSDGIYLGVVPITFDGRKHSIDSDGEIVEYATKMKRIPDENLLKNKLESNEISEKELEDIAKTIVYNHKKAETNDKIKEFGKIKAVKKNTDENFEQTEKYIGKTIEKKNYNELKKWTENFYKDNKELFERRIKEGKIKDCHGDLHTEHICIMDKIHLIDCIEFNERFRYADILSDLGFLLMDLEFRENFKEAKKIHDAYILESKEENIENLINFYKVYRACVRGKVTCFLLDNPQLEESKKEEITKKASKYFKLAKEYIKK